MHQHEWEAHTILMKRARIKYFCFGLVLGVCLGLLPSTAVAGPLPWGLIGNIQLGQGIHDLGLSSEGIGPEIDLDKSYDAYLSLSKYHYFSKDVSVYGTVSALHIFHNQKDQPYSTKTHRFLIGVNF